jgi:hypothetical protein
MSFPVMGRAQNPKVVKPIVCMVHVDMMDFQDVGIVLVAAFIADMGVVVKGQLPVRMQLQDP